MVNISDPAPKRPAPLALTLGDAAGVGPELVLRTAVALQQETPVVVYGSERVIRAASKSLLASCGPLPALRKISHPSEAAQLPTRTVGVIDVLPQDQLASLSLSPYPWGQAIAAFGRLQHAALLRAIDDAMNGDVSAIMTAPWHKARLRDAGLPPTGHTEVLASASGTERVVMVLAGDVLRVALATVHLPLKDVADALTTEGIVAVGQIFADGLKHLYGFDAPRIAICGLNPHAGEDGVLGSEDREIVAPAIRELNDRGVDADGPFPSDTIFPRVGAGLAPYDGVLAMYHDQGLGPLKTLHFGRAANITFGLPFIRTSVDHGTAYDIAGQGIADTSSFLYAARLAVTFAGRREHRVALGHP